MLQPIVAGEAGARVAQTVAQQRDLSFPRAPPPSSFLPGPSQHTNQSSTVNSSATSCILTGLNRASVGISMMQYPPYPQMPYTLPPRPATNYPQKSTLLQQQPVPPMTYLHPGGQLRPLAPTTAGARAHLPPQQLPQGAARTPEQLSQGAARPPHPPVLPSDLSLPGLNSPAQATTLMHHFPNIQTMTTTAGAPPPPPQFSPGALPPSAPPTDEAAKRLKWQKDEELGENATLCAVLYANTVHPELKHQYPGKITIILKCCSSYVDFAHSVQIHVLV